MKLETVTGSLVPWMAFAWLVRLSFVITILVWIDRMKKTPCECSGSWKREYVFWSMIVDVILRAGMYAFFDSLPGWSKAMIAVYDLVQLTVLWSYTIDLEKKRCECSRGWIRDTAQAWPILRLGILVGALQFAFLFAPMLIQATKHEKKGGR